MESHVRRYKKYMDNNGKRPNKSDTANPLKNIDNNSSYASFTLPYLPTTRPCYVLLAIATSSSLLEV